MSETWKIATISAADVVGHSRLAAGGADARAPAGAPEQSLRPSDLRRIASRYDKLARNFFSALCFVATLAYSF
jgi:hypothetical protein